MAREGDEEDLLMQGKRVYADKNGSLTMAPGDYGQDPRDGTWYARPPVNKGHSGWLKNHQVTEHEDGTITVSPSILVEWGDGVTWHGFLERGIWRIC